MSSRLGCWQRELLRIALMLILSLHVNGRV